MSGRVPRTTGPRTTLGHKTVAKVLRDPAVDQLPDGPLRRFLTLLRAEGDSVYVTIHRRPEKNRPNRPG